MPSVPRSPKLREVRALLPPLREEGYRYSHFSRNENGFAVMNFVREMGNSVRYEIGVVFSQIVPVEKKASVVEEEPLPREVVSLTGKVGGKTLIFASDLDNVRRDTIIIAIDRGRALIKSEQDVSAREMKIREQRAIAERPIAGKYLKKKA